MAEFFSNILNMSMTGSIVIAAVLLIRLLMKRLPKIYAYVLWSVVLFRLLCPVSFSGPVSLLDWLELEVSTTSERMNTVAFVSYERNAVATVTQETAQNLPDEAPVVAETEAPKQVDGYAIAFWVWAAGCCVMVLCAVGQYVRLRKQLVVSSPLNGNVYLTDDLDMPFVVGVLFPKIYLPTSIPIIQRPYILAHERHHIRRGDHIFKLLAYGALCIHWFNPLVWLAFLCAGKDMEMSCDEAVLRKLGPEIRADYSTALLRLAAHRTIIAGTPLAFGEGDTKGRVLNMARWKKPTILASVICIAVCVIVLVACAVNPKTETTVAETTPAETTTDDNETVQGTIVSLDIEMVTCADLKLVLPKGITSQKSETFDGSMVIKEYTFYSGDKVVGGLALRHQEEDSGNYDEEWEKSIGVPEAADPSMAYIGGSSLYGDWEMTYFPDIPLNYDEEGKVIRDENGAYALDNEVTHYFFVEANNVYDLWLYNNRFSRDLQTQILQSVQIGELPETAGPSSGKKLPIGDVEISALPSGYSRIYNEDGGIFFARKDAIVGGVDAYAVPMELYDPEDTTFFWLEKAGISDFGDSSLFYSGGMTGSNGGWTAQFVSDVPQGQAPTVERYHYFRVVGDKVYDIWYDMLQLERDEGLDLIYSVDLPEAEVPHQSQALTPENIALQAVRDVYNTVQNDASCQIVVEEQFAEGANPSGYISVHYWHDGTYLGICRMLVNGKETRDGEFYSRQARLVYGDACFTNEGHWTEPGDIQWSRGEEADVFEEPHLTRFVWVKAHVTYVDTVETEEGVCYKYRINKKFQDTEGSPDSYLADYYFDKDGKFLKVVYQFNPNQDNAYTVTESIVSLDPDVVSAEIEKEYRNAVDQTA
ncbi:MAG TPA: hypothetical protein IAB83_00955 [Candidatus Faecousia faecavium]|nr:hypothetical protein [Candidatus Faecousia faecavium]